MKNIKVNNHIYHLARSFDERNHLIAQCNYKRYLPASVCINYQGKPLWIIRFCKDKSKGRAVLKKVKQRVLKDISNG